MNIVYILRCSDGTFYTGYTTDLNRRIKTHNLKKGSKYTRSRTPVELVFYIQFQDKSQALRAEIRLKKLTHSQKQLLIEGKLDVDWCI